MIDPSSVSRPVLFETESSWNPARPHTLVVACSDGRLQEEVDQFLRSQLGISHYDRLYVPGGAGSLSASGSDFIRAYELQSQCRALTDAHGTKHVILLFHGPAEGGPEAAICLDYRRKLPGRSADDIRRQQDSDARELLVRGMGPGVTVATYRCEVRGDGLVQVVALDGAVQD